MRLNGWRRLGIVLAGVWLLGCTLVLAYERSAPRDGFFVFRTLPTGTLIKGNEATLQDGRTVQLRQKLDGKEIKPWEIQWDNEPEIPTVAVVKAGTFFLVGLVFPLLLLAALELFAVLCRWVRKGFGH